MKSITPILMAASMLLSITSCSPQVKNAKTEKAKVYGNCEMCEKTIEEAGSKPKAAKVDWDQNSKMAVLTYDSTQTSADEILRRIALAGYDSEGFLAPDEAYKNLPECCQYKRPKNTEEKAKETPKAAHEHATSMTDTKNDNQVKSLLEKYLSLKESLVKSDASASATKAKELLEAVNAVKMEKLSPREHTVWMKVTNELATDAGHISETKDIAHQRDHFASLSKNMHALLKASDTKETIYYQHCPMFNDGKGANWLSRESNIKNPYYGSQMLTCGKTVETIK